MGREGEPVEGPTRPREPAVQRVRLDARNQRLPALTALAVVFIGLSILKPWGAIGDQPTPPPRDFRATPTPAPVEPTSETPEGVAAPVCLDAGAWRLASLETWRTQDVRVWRAVEPVGEASGPLDPAIPVVPVIALEVGALGWCAPAYGPEKPVGPADVQAWTIVDGSPSRLPLLRVLPTHGETQLAALYVPLTACDAGDPCPSTFSWIRRLRWTSGRVVFRYEDAGTGRIAWFGADIELIPSPTAAPASGGLQAPAGG
jgi:hypothetical protein